MAPRGGDGKPGCRLCVGMRIGSQGASSGRKARGSAGQILDGEVPVPVNARPSSKSWRQSLHRHTHHAARHAEVHVASCYEEDKMTDR